MHTSGWIQLECECHPWLLPSEHHVPDLDLCWAVGSIVTAMIWKRVRIMVAWARLPGRPLSDSSNPADRFGDGQVPPTPSPTAYQGHSARMATNLGLSDRRELTRTQQGTEV